MHRVTPVMTAIRAFTAGGARSCVDQIADGHFMQEMAGNFMKGETRSAIESPQNYGFTSVVADADKDSNGAVTACAEAFISFMGGNRSFPVASIMDDRRHRLMGLEKGDTAMFRQKDDGQQFHMTQDGGFWSAQTEKTVRMQLVDKQQQGGQQQGSGASTRDTTGGSSGSSSTGGQQGGQQMGQKPVYKDGQKSYRFVDVTKDASRLSGNEAHLMLSDGDSYVHCTGQKAYLGGNASKHQFSKVLTEDGVAINVYAKIAGRSAHESAVILDPPGSSVPGDRRHAAAGRTVLPVVMLLLGLSLGINYALITDALGTAMVACRVLASR